MLVGPLPAQGRRFGGVVLWPSWSDGAGSGRGWSRGDRLGAGTSLAATKGGWVYIMANGAHGTPYIGVTADLAARVGVGGVSALPCPVAPAQAGV